MVQSGKSAMAARDDCVSPATAGRGARRLPRLKTELINCELGAIVNLSMVGMCVRTTCVKAGDEHSINVTGFEMSAGPLLAVVIWVSGDEAGLRFIKAAKTVRKTLSDLAMLAREKRTFQTTPAPSIA